MIIRDIYISRCDWTVRIYYAVTDYHTEQIVRDLLRNRCPYPIVQRVREKMAKRNLDSGFTYSNTERRDTVMVVGLHSSPAEFLNSLEHELRHLVDDISKTIDIDPAGEAVAYITGDINALIAPDVQLFICDCDKHRKLISREIVKQPRQLPQY